MPSQACIVTGGASGIGLRVALELQRRGHRVAVIDKHEATDLPGIFSAQADLTDSNAADQAFSRCIEAIGGLDAAVNSAGIFGPLATIENIDDEHLDAITFGNIRLCLFSMRSQLRFMRKSGRGRIVNIASVAGSYGIVQKGDYCAAKHAIIGLTRTAALENVKHSIAVNSVSPGFVATPMTDFAIKENPLLETFITKQTPLGRSLSPDAVSALVCWLVADAPLEITGSDYVIDGCYSAR